ncbi:hypothetical protein Ancab_039161 [Ancistrocladus abbreviatus]
MVEVAGFKTVFQQHSDPEQLRIIPREEMFRFSHRVPSCLLRGQESPDAPIGCWELDPAATPLELLQVIAVGIDKKNAEKTTKDDVSSAKKATVDDTSGTKRTNAVELVGNDGTTNGAGKIGGDRKVDSNVMVTNSSCIGR